MLVGIGLVRYSGDPPDSSDRDLSIRSSTLFPLAAVLAFRPEEYSVHTELYDGPLELLLYLIKRDGIDVADIPIAHVTDEYLLYLERMQQMDLGVAGDFLVMAATLCQLKSHQLLPRELEATDEEDEFDPREQLARRLMEYERFKEASEKLLQRNILGRDTFKRPAAQLSATSRGVDPTVDVFGLLEAFYAAVEAREADEPVHQVQLETHSFADRVGWVLDRLDEGITTLRGLFRGVQGRPQRILTFLAVLEMARLGLLDVRQVDHLGVIEVLASSSRAEADLSGLPEHWENA
ncbi:MAG TPA: segregation/condensation protein A [Myxococcota bacterium]|nr:segregation/condensation protein A [Myxococcota bacterium]